MKRNSLMCLKIFIVLVVFTVPSFANDKGFPAHGPGLSLPDWLDLTSEQADKIRLLRIAFEESIAPLESAMQQKHAELRVLWLQIKPNAAKIKSAQKAIHDIQYQILEKIIDLRINIRGVLTESQAINMLALGDPEFPGHCERLGNLPPGPGAHMMAPPLDK